MNRDKKHSFKKVTFNDEALQTRVFSEACKSSLKVVAIVCELANDAGFTSLDDLYETTPEIIDNYCRIANTALRALKKVEEREKRKN